VRDHEKLTAARDEHGLTRPALRGARFFPYSGPALPDWMIFLGTEWILRYGRFTVAGWHPHYNESVTDYGREYIAVRNGRIVDSCGDAVWLIDPNTLNLIEAATRMNIKGLARAVLAPSPRQLPLPGTTYAPRLALAPAASRVTGNVPPQAHE